MTAAIVRFPELHRLTGLSRCSIRRLEAASGFPHRIQLSPNAVGWRADDVTRWIEERRVAKAQSC